LCGSIKKKNTPYVPLRSLPNSKAQLLVGNSTLSEYGVMGFELGFSLEHPNALVLWEAQFGDFANGAQVIIDQFLSCGEQKWLRQSGLVLLLPHGYDGQGPEHSSARLERFLQLSDSDPDNIPDLSTPELIEKNDQERNWQVLNLSTSANYFHSLRRQIHRDFRKPLVIMSPKNLLRLREASSNFEDFETGSIFHRLIPEATPQKLVPNDQVKRLIYCSGKVYYELIAHREATKTKNVAIVRVEQLIPFPFDLVAAEAQKYKNAELAWAQEEPKNMGAFSFTYHHIRSAVRKDRGPTTEVTYIGRKASASPATGSIQIHHNETEEFLEHAVTI